VGGEAEEPRVEYVSRGGLKLAAALDRFGISPEGRVCADLGCSTGGFSDVLLRRGAARVHAVDTGYGVLAWRLRADPRVVVHERTNALRVSLPEPCALVVIDCGWTRQELIVPRALDLLVPGGDIVSLLKPQYEAPPGWLTGGRLPPERLADVEAAVVARLEALPGPSGPLCHVVAAMPSPLPGGKGGNLEILLHVRPGPAAA